MRKESQMSAKQFKAAFMNKAATGKAKAQMKVRSNLAVMIKDGVPGAAKAHKALNEVWTKRVGSPGEFHKGGKALPCVSVAQA